MSGDLSRAAELLSLVEATTRHGTAFNNIAAMAQLELKEIEKRAAKNVVQRQREIEENEKREAEDRARRAAAERARDAGQKGTASPVMVDRTHQVPSAGQQTHPTTVEAPRPPTDPLRQPGVDPQPPVPEVERRV